MVAWVFAGQGAQRRGMGGAALFDRHAELVAEADAVLGHSVRELCLADPEGRLGRTEFAQPALFVVATLQRLDRPGPAPRFLAGHSVGEYAALHAAGCFDFATGVRLVRERGRLMGEAAGGGMLAVVGAGPDEVERLLREHGAADVDLANLNSPRQVVLSGPTAAVQAVAAALDGRAGLRCVPLRVSAAFHSRYMAAAAAEFGRVLAGVSIADPAVPVVSNVTARPYGPGTVAELLRRQITAPVRWAESMQFLRGQGVTELVELGPGGVLTRLWGENPAAAPPPAVPDAGLTAERLGDAGFRAEHGLRLAYVAGAMYHGVASTDLVVRLGRAGLLGYFGAGGLPLEQVARAIDDLEARLGPGGRYGMNLLHALDDVAAERAVVDLYLRRGVRRVEAAGYPALSAPLVRYRFHGARLDGAGRPVVPNAVLAKVSRPEVAAAFLRPPPRSLLDRLLADGDLTAAEVEAAERAPVSRDVCVEADSAGHTDGGVMLTLLPSIRRLAARTAAEHGYAGTVRIGAAGGLGSPESVAAAFVLGADFVVTGSVNQCSPQAGTSDAVKDLLASLDVQDTGYAPAGDMFELGAQVQVARKGTLFAARAGQLYRVYRRFEGPEDLDPASRATVERVLGRTLEDAWAETRAHLARSRPDQLAAIEATPKRRLAWILRGYFARSSRAARLGTPEHRADYEVHCGPAMGAFNRTVAGTDLADWRCRDVDRIAEVLMEGAAAVLRERLGAMAGHAQH